MRATLAVDETVPSKEHVIKGNLFYQACSSTVCLPPENVSFTIPVLVVPIPSPKDPFMKKQDPITIHSAVLKTCEEVAE